MVVKESIAHWDQENEFFGPIKDIPREHYMSMVLPKGSRNTVNVMGSRLSRDRDCFRLYMEYCPGGDLSRLWGSYSNLSLAFPEPYLWKLLRDLARAVHAMDNPSGHGLEGDEAIAHIDFKPENIFLCLPDENEFPKYPIGKLADFGGAIFCSPRDAQEVHAKKVSECKLIEHQQMVVTLLTFFQGAAVSAGYVAPDVERFFKYNNAEVIPARDARPGVTIEDIPRRVTTATNVWNAGLIILDLMSPQQFIPPKFGAQAYTARDTWLDNTVNQMDTDPRLKGYSKLLKETVIRCLNYDPSRRPTPEDLLVRVDIGVNSHCGIMQTKDCLDTQKNNGQYDLDPRIAFSDDYPITQKSGEWTMADGGADNDDDDDEDFPFAKPPGGGGPTPKTPHGKAQARPSYSTTEGAPVDTPFKGFVFGPNAGASIRNFFGAPDEDYEMVDRPEPRHGFSKTSGMREAREDDIPDRQDARPEPPHGFVKSSQLRSQLRQAMQDEMMGG